MLQTFHLLISDQKPQILCGDRLLVQAASGKSNRLAVGSIYSENYVKPSV